MIGTLDRKLLRDLKQLSGQVLTICLVVASGIAVYIAMHSTYRSLHLSKETYYEKNRFSHVFARADRVPESVEAELRAIPGVATVETRTVEEVRIPLGPDTRAASGRIVSIPDRGEPAQNNVFVRRGRLPEPDHGDEVLVLQSFAEKHQLSPGDTLTVVLNGSERELTISGTAMSPEYVFALGGDVLSYEPGKFAVLWMRHSAVGAAFDMNGAFNDVVLRLQPGASEPDVLLSLDRLLDPYGGFGAFGRDKHQSHHFVTSELSQLEVQATFVPAIFLAVAAFLVNVVLSRLVELQRGQIATLKAVGYSNLAVGLHLLKLVSVIVLLGSAVGIATGAWLGSALIGVYEQYFSFPVFAAQVDADVVAWAVLISLSSAVVGSFVSVRHIVAMPPAEAMRPPAPPAYRMTVLDHISKHLFGVIGRMVVREVARNPWRVLVSSLGIAMAVAILVIGRFMVDSMDHLLDLQFSQSTRQDLTVSLRQPVPSRVASSILDLPGVTHVEHSRAVPVRVRFAAITRDTVLEGLPRDGSLRTVIDRDGKAVSMPQEGILLSDVLAERLGVRPGQFVEATIMEGKRRTLRLPVTGVVADMLGMQAYADFESVSRWLRESPTTSTLLLCVDSAMLDDAERRLYELPAVAGVVRPAGVRKSFEDQQGGSMMVMTFVLVFFASVIAVGIVYNNARVSLSMRSRDLASMRVLGYTRGEISTVLLGELGLQVLLALPVGMWLGTQASEALLSTDPENFRMPAMISMRTYAFAALITMASTLVSALLVRRKLDQLDLIGVLKTRE